MDKVEDMSPLANWLVLDLKGKLQDHLGLSGMGLASCSGMTGRILCGLFLARFPGEKLICEPLQQATHMLG